MSKPVVIIGDGWAALGAVSLILSSKTSVYWITGTGARMMSPLPTLEVGQGLRGSEVWKEIFTRMGIETGELQSGSFLREFRNKSFREPVWTKSLTAEERAQVVREELWMSEVSLVPLLEGRFSLTLNDLETQLREKLISESALKEFPQLKRITEIPVTGFRIVEGNVQAVILGSGEEIETNHVIYADRWSSIAELQGLPKGLPFLRKREPMSVLQTVFTHEGPIGVGILEGFYGPLQKEAGDDTEKHVWGHFSSDGLRSFWTLCVTGEEVEDNHAIAKKLRRMKNALEKIFVGESWRPVGKAENSEFMATVCEEQVRFEESVLFTSGDILQEPIHLPKVRGLVFMTDGYGPSSALHQVGHEFGLFAERKTDPQTESMDLSNPSTLEAVSSST